MYRRLDVEEGDDYPAERLERRPSVDLCMLIYRFAELCECGEVEELWGQQILILMLAVFTEVLSKTTYGDYESVRRRRRLYQRWQV